MRPPRKPAILAAVVLATSALAGAAGRETIAAFSSQTSNSVTTLTAAPDYMPPAITSAKIMKNSGYSAGFLKQGSGYYVYANVSADTGNPASGISTVRTDVSNVTTGATSVALNTTGGPWTVEGVSYNYRTALQTANASLSAGDKTFSVTATDNDSNSGSLTGETVTVDNTAPTVTGGNVQLNNKAGGVAGKAEVGDTIVYTLAEPLDPNSVLSSAGWTGASLTVTVRINNVGGATGDQVQIYNSTNATLANMGTINLIDTAHVTANRTFGSSTMVQSGNTITVTLGTASGTTGTVATARTATWAPSTSSYDRAANNFSTSAGTTVSEAAPSDVDF